jgi:hypothetical protein
VDLDGQVELVDGSFALDGAVIRSGDHTLIAVGVRVGFLGQQTHWAPIERLVRADGARAWFAMTRSELIERPPDGIWLRTGLVVRHGSEHLGTLAWLGIVGNQIEELGVVPRDPRTEPRRLKIESVHELNDRSVEVTIDDLADAPRLRTDRDLEEEVHRRLWETAGSLPPEALERITISVRGGVAWLSGMLPKNQHRSLALAIAMEPLEMRGVVNQIETAEDLTMAARRLQAVTE